MLTVLIVDDEPAARSRMLELLSGDREIAVVGEVALSNQSCELIFRRRLATWEESLPQELFPRLGRS
jgi:DNA-binding LytR/AlgR family response regulator